MLQAKMRLLLLTTLLTMAIAIPATAAVEEGSSSFEIYTGVYFPDGDAFDENLTYGLRFGHVFTSNWGGEISGGYYQDDITIASIETDLDIINVDLDIVFFANPDSKAVFTVFGGIGWANTDIEITDKLLGGTVSADSDSFTANAGIGGRFYFGSNERVYLRLDGKARYFEDRDDDEVDFEGTLALGWVFGG